MVSQWRTAKTTKQSINTRRDLPAAVGRLLLAVRAASTAPPLASWVIHPRVLTGITA